MSGTWDFDISAAPKGGFTEGMVLKGPKGKERLVQTYHAPVLIVATKCGKVTTTKWLHEEGRWQMLAAGEDFIAWQPWPTHPNYLGPHSQEVDDGQPHPSSNVSGAKRDGAQTIVGRADDRSDLSITQLEQQDASASQDRNEPISDSEATVTHSNTRDPRVLEVDDGQPRTQSSDACCAKRDGGHPVFGHGGVKPNHRNAQSEQSVTHSNTTLATSPDASRKAGEGSLLPLSPAAISDDDVPAFMKRGAA